MTRVTKVEAELQKIRQMLKQVANTRAQDRSDVDPDVQSSTYFITSPAQSPWYDQALTALDEEDSLETGNWAEDGDDEDA
jgi:hypothetical protein